MNEKGLPNYQVKIINRMLKEQGITREQLNQMDEKDWDRVMNPIIAECNKAKALLKIKNTFDRMGVFK